jgi:ketosteroid isomerase-like protein
VVAARDTAAIRTFYTDDAVYAPQGRPSLRGVDSVSSEWAWEFSISGFQLERTPIRIEVAKSGDLATELGTYVVHFERENKSQTATGAYMTSWRKVGNDWKMASYLWNRSTKR